MTELFKKLAVIDYEPVRLELEKAVQPFLDQRQYTPSLEWVQEMCPKFFELVKEKVKFPEGARALGNGMYRLYITPPKGSLSVHCDWMPVVPTMNINFPVIGCEDTHMHWYETDQKDPNLFMEDGYSKNFPITKVKDESKLKEIVSTAIDVPTIVRTNTLHNVTNNTDHYRVIMAVRMAGIRCKEFEDVWKF